MTVKLLMRRQYLNFWQATRLLGNLSDVGTLGPWDFSSYILMSILIDKITIIKLTFMLILVNLVENLKISSCWI